MDYNDDTAIGDDESGDQASRTDGNADQPTAVYINSALRQEPQLTQDDKRFLLSVERGDMASVEKMLDGKWEEKDPNLGPININATDPLGKSLKTFLKRYHSLPRRRTFRACLLFCRKFLKIRFASKQLYIH